jgi:flagellar FliL protein
LKANPKAKADPKAAEAAPAGSNKTKLLIIILAAVLLLGGVGGGAAWFFLHGKAGAEEEAPAKKKKASKPAGPPVFVPIEPFTVNLQPAEGGGDQYLQLAITLQVPELEEAEVFKNNMPKVRSRMLLLLSAKHASELSSPEGKQQLSREIVALLKEPFEEHGNAQEINDVLFTSFIIQ